MFTGLIEEIGNVVRVDTIAGGKRIKIHASKIMDDIKVDDSICVNGVCLTATKIDADGFCADAVGATIEKTTIKNFKTNSAVNLERAVKLSDRLGGHLVQGHVSNTAVIDKISKLGENYFIELKIPSVLLKYIIDEGSIAVDGISLTVANITGPVVGLSIIPYTWMHTNLHLRKSGDVVNIETDVIAKYVEKLLENKKNGASDTFSDTWFKKLGY